jgi:FkbM family methyltransferase
MKQIAKKVVRRLFKQFPALYRSLNRVRGWRIHDAEMKLQYVKVGGSGGEHDYGAWVVPTGLLNQDSIVYSVGIGDDISFDRELISRFGCDVFAYDPVPVAVDYVRSSNIGQKFIFQPIGLSSKDGTDYFTAPDSKEESFKKSANIEGEGAHGFPVRRLKTLMDMNNHAYIDLLKMDIEGFEYEVIDDMLASDVLPKCLLLEFHHFQRKDPQSTRDAVEKLKKAGFSSFWISELGAEYGFFRVEKPTTVAV